MGIINNLSQPQLSEIFRRLSALENAAPMNNGAVGRSGFEVYDGGNINISNGSITINGYLSGGGSFAWTGSFIQSGTTTLSGSTTIAGPTGITGTLTIQGATSVTGPFTVTGVTKLDGKTDVGGAFTVTGLTKLQGDTTVSGTLDVTGAMATKGTLSVEGITTLKNDLRVVSGGKITVGQMTIDPTANGGSVRFPNNQNIYAEASRLVAASLKLTGTLEVTNAVVFKGLQSTTQAANVYYDVATGTLRYKA